MEILELFKQSDVWDKRYNLPLVPHHNNPFIYNAYATQIIKQKDPILNAAKLNVNFYLYLSACEKEKGLYYRWPDKSGGAFSWDEIVGVASVSAYGAMSLYIYLKRKWGVYDNGELPEKKWRFFRFNQYRYPFLLPYLKASSCIKLNYLDKLIIYLFLKLDSYNYKSGDEGGRLRIWLMCFNLETQMPEAVNSWREAMNKKTDLHKCFKAYFHQYPVFHENCYLYF